MAYGFGQKEDNSENAQNPMGALFPIFMLTMLSLVLIPATLWRLCNCGATEKKKTKKLQGVADKHSDWGKLAAKQAEKLKPNHLKNFMTTGNVTLIVGWLMFFVLIWAINSLSREIAPFEPYDILGLPSGASMKDIKKAYREMSLKYHPDKNPDPKAHKYFAEYITKAYQALTDDVSRKNMEDFGHPDGPQSMQVGIALPAFMFEKGSMAPLVLALTVGIGILLPLGIAVCYLIRSSKYTGNHILQQTVHAFNYVLKPAMNCTKLLEVLCLAGEYCMLPLPHTQSPVIPELVQLVKSEVDVKDKKFFQRHPAAVKAHMLLVAQTLREGPNIPEPLQADFHVILQAVPKLMDELMKTAMRPRNPFGYGWLRPAIAVLELSQSLVQAVPTSGRKPSEKGGGDSGVPSLVQLPHVDDEVIKKLIRKKVRGLGDLMALPKAERAKILEMADYSEGAVNDMEHFLELVPVITLAAECIVEDEGDDEDQTIMEGDVVTCQINVRLNRFGCVQKGKGVGAGPGVAPFFPCPKEEVWWALLGDPAQNALFVAQEVNLEEMEYVPAVEDGASANRTAAMASSSKGASKDQANGDGDSDLDAGEDSPLLGGLEKAAMQSIKMTFRAPPAGIYNLQLVLMSDYWIGCDKRVNIKLKVAKGAKMTKAEKEGRDEESEVDSDFSGEEEGVVEEEDDYDSEDVGTSESEDEN